MDTFEISSDNYNPSSLHRSERREGGQNPSGEGKRAGSNNSGQQGKNATHENRKEVESDAFLSPGSRWKIFLGIVLIVISAYLLIVSISYFAHGANDQSIVQGRNFSEIADNGERISNTGGPAGAYLSNLLLSRWLGIGSFVLIFYLGALGISLVRVHKFKFWNLTYKCLLTAIMVSVLLGFVTYSFTSHNYWGGDHGYMVNHYVMENAGIMGAIGLNILLVAAVVLVFLRQIQTTYMAYHRRIERHREKIAREKAVSEARRKEREKRMTADPISYEPGEKGKSEESETTGEPAYQREQIKTNPSEARGLGRMSELEELETEDSDENFVETTRPEINGKNENTVTTTESEKPQPMGEISAAEPKVMETPAMEELAEIPVVDDPAESTSVFSSVLPSVAKEESVAEDAEPFPETYDPTLELSRFRNPSLDLLDDKVPRTDHVDMLEQEENKARLTETLRTFGVKISHIEATVGPTITRYEIIPAEGVRTRSVKSLGEDLALTLQALGVRIIAPIPGKGTIGIEVPNKDPQTVFIRNVLGSEKFRNFEGELPIALGTTITNDVYVADLAKLPHLLVAGATGMGKSVGLNTIICSLLYKKHPAELKFVLVDPKRVELSLYRSLERHYLAALPGEDTIITDMTKVVPVLNSLCKEMEERLELLQAAEVRNIKEYNTKFKAKKLNPKKHRFLPYIVLVIDEFADIILTQGREVENPVSRIAAVARAAGIHMIIATQRPAVNVITGGIKTNIPGRMAFRVNQGVDSRTIIDQVGANLLNGKGDMLFSRDGIIDRVQGAFISTEEVKAVVDSIGDQIGYDEPYQLPEYVDSSAEGGAVKGGALTDRDPLFEEAGRLVVNSASGSTTMLQRKLQIGFGRAARIMDQLEIAGVVGPAQGGKPRDVLMDMYAFERYLTPPPAGE